MANNRWWLVAFFVLNVFDVVSTVIGVTAGLFIELNPLGFHNAVILKISLLLFLVALMSHKKTRMAFIGSKAFLIVKLFVWLYALLALWHFIQWYMVLLHFISNKL
jgi:hypothetical protein